jgi:hypothetical protein
MSIPVTEAMPAHIRATILDDGAVLVDLERQACYRLDRRATLVWLRLCHETPVSEISREMARHFGNAVVAASIVESLLHDFEQAGVLPCHMPESEEVD